TAAAGVVAGATVARAALPVDTLPVAVELPLVAHAAAAGARLAALAALIAGAAVGRIGLEVRATLAADGQPAAVDRALSLAAKLPAGAGVAAGAAVGAVGEQVGAAAGARRQAVGALALPAGAARVG